MELTKIDLSKLVAVGHANGQLALLIDRGETIEYLEIPAPVDAYQRLQHIHSLAANRLIDITPEANRIEASEEDRQISMLPVRSAMASAIGYDEAHHTLQVEFLNGSVYQYSDVDAQIWKELRESSSVGKVYNAKVKGNFPSRRLEF